MNRVLMVGSAEQSGGGVASVLRLMKTMPFWKNIGADGLVRRYREDMA